MIQLDEFLDAIELQLNRKLNQPQLSCITHPQTSALMIVAGPGSGKTTVLVLRALRHIFVDNIAPENIVITTFTRKAASEIRSRLIGWGLSLIEHFSSQVQIKNNSNLLANLKSLDINLCQTGTLDSFCQKWLSATRPVGSPNPIMLEEFAANFIYRRKIFGPQYRNSNKDILNDYFAKYTFENQQPRNQGAASSISEEINNRLIQDLVDETAYASTPGSDVNARNVQQQLLSNYRSYLKQQLLYDFSLCGEEILKSLKAGTLYPNPSIPEIKALLIDEYQDTNPLQEAIYFELAKLSKAPVTVVGDDDQALYRFRGATVELFTDFQNRFKAANPSNSVHVEYLSINHRSTPQIINYFNTFVTHDSGFSQARVNGKPPVGTYNPDLNIPVLGLFRDSLDGLADSLADFLDKVFIGQGYKIPNSNTVLKAESGNGALGDAVLLSSSVREFKDDGGARLPALLRNRLNAKGQNVFNPRGQDLRDIPKVKVLLGLVLLCLDKSQDLESDMFLTNDTKSYLIEWRATASQYIAQNPTPFNTTYNLQSYVNDWAHRNPVNGSKWPDEIPLLDLFYKLIVWLPEFQNDPEHLIYLEAVLRCVAQGAHYSAYGLNVLNTAPHDIRSRKSVFSDLLAPIAERVVDIDEDLLFSVPRSRLSIMTIHQSKGLEYPLVIVDVGSEFKMNHRMQAFRRFPTKASNTVLMESDIAPFTPVGSIRSTRSDLDRTFDDLMRLYYVAFSRAQVALLLVGHNKCVEYNTSVKNIATSWTRSETWSWRVNNPPLSRGTPPYPENIPLTLL